jgi:uncharacterized membrane protein
MAALAYVLLPVSGAIAYFNARSARLRFHGLQAISLGLIWPAALYGASQLSRQATQLVWGLGAVVWILLMLLTATGKDVRLPVLGRFLQRAAQESPKSLKAAR